jgi:hypothetical protein
MNIGGLDLFIIQPSSLKSCFDLQYNNLKYYKYKTCILC